MARFTIKNLQEVEDTAGKHSPSLESRFARKYLDSEHLGVSLFRYAPNFRSPMGHRHTQQEEAYIVIGGSGRMKLDDEIVDLRCWDVIRVAPEVTRALEGGPEGLEVIVVASDRPEGGDVTTYGWWSD